MNSVVSPSARLAVSWLAQSPFTAMSAARTGTFRLRPALRRALSPAVAAQLGVRPLVSSVRSLLNHQWLRPGRTSGAGAGVLLKLAEDRGFEPLRALTQPAFQASAIGH